MYRGCGVAGHAALSERHGGWLSSAQLGSGLGLWSRKEVQKPSSGGWSISGVRPEPVQMQHGVLVALYASRRASSRA